MISKLSTRMVRKYLQLDSWMTLSQIYHQSRLKFYCVKTSGFSLHEWTLLKISSFSDDDETQNEIKNFRQTLHSEVLSKKVGENPPVAELRPEEVPLIAKMFTDEDDSESKIGKSSVKRENLNKVKDDADEEILEGIKYSNQIIADEGSDMNENDEEIQPQNYFF